MQSQIRPEIDQYWSQELAVDSLEATSPVVCTVQTLYSGVQMFRRADQLLIAAPPALYESVQKAVGRCAPNELFSVEWLQSVLGCKARKILGPAEVSYADETSFRSGDTSAGRALSELDADGLRLLHASLDHREIEESGFSADASPAFGVFVDGALCSAASYSRWEPSIAHIIVASHPEYRRQGLAQTAVRTLAAEALSQGLILQWRAVSWNKKSLSLASELGFRHYCTTIFAQCEP